MTRLEFINKLELLKEMKKVNAIIKNEKGQICHTIKDIVKMSLARNEMLSDTKQYIINNYKDYTVKFEIK